MTADVAKLYRQSALSKDSEVFMVLWRNEPNHKLRHLQLRKVIYGVSSSGYHAVSSLQETAGLTDYEEVRSDSPRLLLI